jgi:UDP-glucose 4-epimerase
MIKIGITGASGAIGSWIAHCLSSDYEVFAYLQENSSTLRLSYNPKIIIRRSNRFRSTKDLIIEDAPKILILCDWSGVGSDSRNDALQLLNMERQTSLVSGLGKVGIETVFGFGSQAELGRVTSIVDEDTLDNPLTEYGRAKVETRKKLSESCKSQGINFYWARIFSAYGLMDSEKWFIPSLISSLEKKQTYRMSTGSQTWSYLNFVDIANAIELLIAHQPNSIIVNIGNPKTNTIREIAENIGNQTRGLELIEFGMLETRDDQTDVMIPYCNTLQSIGWKPNISLDQGIKEIIDWHKSVAVFSATISENCEILIPGYDTFRKKSDVTR